MQTTRRGFFVHLAALGAGLKAVFTPKNSPPAGIPWNVDDDAVGGTVFFLTKPHSLRFTRRNLTPTEHWDELAEETNRRFLTDTHGLVRYELEKRGFDPDDLDRF